MQDKKNQHVNIQLICMASRTNRYARGYARRQGTTLQILSESKGLGTCFSNCILLFFAKAHNTSISKWQKELPANDSSNLYRIRYGDTVASVIRVILGKVFSRDLVDVEFNCIVTT